MKRYTDKLNIPKDYFNEDFNMHIMTAVEWLEEKLENICYDIDMYSWKSILESIEQAKEMEKQQIIDAYQTSHISMMTAEQYYNEKFK